MSDLNVQINDFSKSVCRGMHAEMLPKNLLAENMGKTAFKLEDLEELSLFTSFISKKNNMKVFLVFLLKNFSWKRELMNSYGISNFSISPSLDELEELGFIISRDFYSIDEVYQEAIYKLSPNFTNWINNDPKIYMITEKGKEFGVNFQHFLKEKILKSEVLRHTFDFINKKSNAHRLVCEKILIEEQNTLIRKVKSMYDGVVYEKPTLLNREVKRLAPQIAKELGIVPIKALSYSKQKQQIEHLSLSGASVGKTELEMERLDKERENNIFELLGLEQ